MICMRIGLLEYMEFAGQYGEMKSGQSHDVYATCDNVDRAKASQSAEFFFFLFLFFIFFIVVCAMRQSFHTASAAMMT